MLFFYQLESDEEFGRFEYPKKDLSNVKKDKNCNNRALNYSLKLSQIPVPLVFMEKDGKITNYEQFKLYDEEFNNIGSFVYFKPDIFSKSRRTNFTNHKPPVYKRTNKNKNNQILKKVDEKKYPEYYRKTLENTMRGSNETTPDPFEIGEILAVYIHKREPRKMKLAVRRMYRAEHVTPNDKNTDMNLLF